MSDEYDNVEWNVHATSNTLTPRFDASDPLSSYDPSTFDTQVRWTINGTACCMEYDSWIQLF